MSLRQKANAQNVSTSFLPYGSITYLINSFDYPNLLLVNKGFIIWERNTKV